MLKIKFKNLDEITEANFKEITRSDLDPIIQLTGTNIPKNTSGFYIYNDRYVLLRTCLDCTNIYRELDNGYQFTNDDTVYVPPQDPEDPTDPEKTTLEKAVAENTEKLELLDGCLTSVIVDVLPSLNP